jgi:hypothetical protein
MPKVKIEITLDGSGVEIEKFRRGILAINNNLDSVSVTYPKELLPKKKSNRKV